MQHLFENQLIARKIFSYFDLKTLCYFRTICKATKNVHYYATFVNLINVLKYPNKFFQKLIEQHEKFCYLTMFDFGPGDSVFHYKNIDKIGKITSLFQLYGIQVYNIKRFLQNIDKNKLKYLITADVLEDFQDNLIQYKELKTIVLKDSVREDFSFLENFENLETLFINSSRTRRSFLFPNFQSFENLKMLSLIDFSFFTNEEIFQILSSCKKLNILDLRNTRLILISNIKKYPKNNLQKLFIESNYVFDQLTRCFNNSDNLKSLNVSGGYITFSGIKNLIRNSFNIVELNISFTIINNIDLKRICNSLTKIKILSINSVINISKFDSISKLENLQILFCRNNFLGNKDLLKIIKAKNNLVLIDISGCNFITNSSFIKLTKKSIKKPPQILANPISILVSLEVMDKYHEFHFGV